MSKIFFQKIILLLIFCIGIMGSIHGANAATFQMQTGTYIGNGLDDRVITGVGFEPDMVMIKDNTNIGNSGLIFKTSEMPGELSLVTAEGDAANTTNHIQSLDADGFTVGDDADVNTANMPYYWIAFSGSDCSVGGTFCVGSYTGTGISQSITDVGFQPDLVFTKRESGTVGAWKSSVMSGTESAYLSTTANIASNDINSLDTTGFTVGTRNPVNRNTDVYYYFAFTEVPGFMEVGTYTGNGADNRNITNVDNPGLTFQPDFMWTKAESNRFSVGSIREHYGDRSFRFSDGSSNRNYIQNLLAPNGFQLGSNIAVNQNGVDYYYVAFAGAPNRNVSSETYDMAQGSYTGSASGFSLTGLGFEPDLVVINGDTTQNGVFRTSLMAGDRTAYIAAGATVFTGGILSLDGDGFSLGTNATVNSSGIEYHWTAFGNASRLDRAGGAGDFFVGQYIGTGSDNSNVRALPINPDFITIKRVANTEGVWRTNDQTTGTLSFRDTSENINRIQSFTTGGFQKGTNNRVNTSGGTYDYFLFTKGDRFDTGIYTGNGISQNITGSDFQPDHLWIKKITGGTARAGILRSSQQIGDVASFFTSQANILGVVTDLILGGFSIGSGNESNENGFDFQYASWNNKRYSQESFRFFENLDSTDVGSALSAVDTPGVLADAGDSFRLRMLTRVNGGNLFDSSEEFTLQFAEQSGSCDVGFAGENYTDVTTSSLIAFYDNPTPNDGDGLVSNINDPIDGVRTIVNQEYVELNDFSSSQGVITQEQTGKWDFSLIDNGAPVDTTYCFRIVYADDSTIENYTAIPEITTGSASTQTISFSLSDNAIGFGTLDTSFARYATATGGSGSDVAAHTISASTNAGSGYSISVEGTSLVSGGYSIDAIGPSATISNPGSEQFGIRSVVSSGTGTVSDPFDTTNFAFDDAARQIIASGIGDDVTSIYDLHYLANMNTLTVAGEYTSVITYTITPTY